MTVDKDATVQIIRDSGLLNETWYLRQYQDVALMGMDPVEHYVKYGAMLGRDPSEEFSTTHYARINRKALKKNINPLLYYVQKGQLQKRLIRTVAQDPVRRAHLRVRKIRAKLTSLGFMRLPYEELSDLLKTDPEPAVRAMAAWELALWHVRTQTERGYLASLGYLAAARTDAYSLEFRSKLVTIELLCHYLLDQASQGYAAYERAALAGEITSGAMLAWTNFQATTDSKVRWINEVLRQHDIPAVSLRLDDASSAYDRLQSARTLPIVEDGPKVTVLIAAYNAATTISTSLRSLQEQTWRNLEVIVIDDNSPNDDTCAVVRRFASSDPRIHLVQMPTNGGAYLARNRGLDQATGTYITLHDADDWSHPVKIEKQVRCLETMPNLIGCTSGQARATNDLQFLRLSGSGLLTAENVSSFLWRREPVRTALGYWDTVRFSADNELIRRVRFKFGSNTVQKMETGPLSFQRHSNTSILTDDVMGMHGFYYGARKEYFDAQTYHHASGASLKYNNDPKHRPFPAPALMHSDRKDPLADRHFDVVVAGDFRMLDEALRDVVSRVRDLRSNGRRVGLFQLFAYHNKAADHLTHMHSALREEVDGEAVQVLVYGDKVTCDRLDLVTPGCDLGDSRYAPEVIVRERR